MSRPTVEPWQHWVKARAVPEQGGQSDSFFAIAADGSGSEVFIKTLKRQREPKARGRFRREVAAYETLRAPGIPRLVEHNAAEWDTGIPLYLALESIDGENLAQVLRRRAAPLTVNEAFVLVDRLSQTLSICHEDGVIHRDIKPQNIMIPRLPDGAPVLVDFGLSFNDADETHLTDVREEVGNRFLRLPEHIWGGRSPVSDVTQLVGILLFGLTGIEPRVLLDADGNPPHLRQPARDLLAGHLTGRPLRRLLQLFDVAFASPAAKRFQSADELRVALRRVLSSDDTDDSGDEEADFAVALSDPTFREHTARTRTLAGYLKVAGAVYFSIVKGNGLQTHQTGHHLDSSATPPYGHTRLGLSLRAADEPAWVSYRFELRAPAEVILVVDQEDRWRGTSPDEPELTRIIRSIALRALLPRDGNESKIL